jgi:hypothetical protein
VQAGKGHVEKEFAAVTLAFGKSPLKRVAKTGGMTA